MQFIHRNDFEGALAHISSLGSLDRNADNIKLLEAYAQYRSGNESAARLNLARINPQNIHFAIDSLFHDLRENLTLSNVR